MNITPTTSVNSSSVSATQFAQLIAEARRKTGLSEQAIAEKLAALGAIVNAAPNPSTGELTPISFADMTDFIEKIQVGLVTDADLTPLPELTHVVSELDTKTETTASNSNNNALMLNADEINAFLDKAKAGTVTDAELTQVRETIQKLSGLVAQLDISSNNAASALPTVNVPDVNAFLDRVKAGTVTDSDLRQMRDYAQGLSGLAAKINVAASTTDDDSSQVDFSDIKIFLSKVKAGSVTDADLAQLQERISKYEQQRSSHPQHYSKQSFSSSDKANQQLLDALFSANSLSGSDGITGTALQSLKDDLAIIRASTEGNDTSSQSNTKITNDFENHIHKQILLAMIQAYSASKEKLETQEMEA